MKISQKIKIVVGSLVGVAVLLLAVLIIHIAIMVKGKPPIVNPTVQMARADFKEPVDSLSAARIQGKIQALKGVKSTYFNPKDDILIYTFDNTLNTAQGIYDQAIKNAGFAATRYTVSPSDLAGGCPVMNDHNFYGKLTALITQIIN